MNGGSQHLIDSQRSPGGFAARLMLCAVNSRRSSRYNLSRIVIAGAFAVALLILGRDTTVAFGDPADSSSLTPAEQKFVRHYAPYYPQGSSPQAVLALAHGTCSLLRRGVPLETITGQVRMVIPQLTEEEAAEALGWSAATECEEMTARFRAGAQ
jgi:hypothetical protein